MMDIFEDDVMVKQTKLSHQEEHSDFIKSLHVEEIEKLIATFKDSITNTPDIDQEKIQHFREEVLADRYQIGSKQIVNKLLELVRPITAEPEMA